MQPTTLPGETDHAVPRALVYLRVSTRRQMDTDADTVADGNSIDTQRKETAAKLKQLGAVLAEDGEYLEPGNSAQSIAKRPVFRAMLKRIAEKRDVEYVVVYMRSRAFRNALDALTTKFQLKQLGVKLISAKEDFGDSIWADAMEAITDVVNEVQVRQNGEDIKVKMANKVANGGTPTRAKLGYLNTTLVHEGRRINTVVVDEARKHFILMAFELFATGRYTIESLHGELTRAGLRSRATVKFPGGRPIGFETLRGILRDRYYLGWVSYKGMEYQGRHETFVPETLFERVQRVLASHQGAGVRERKHPHYLKGWVWCNRCGKRFTVQRAIGRAGGEYYYFFCMGRQDGTCDHPYVPVEEMEQAIARHYRTSVTFPEDFRAEVRAMADDAAGADTALTGDRRQQFEQRLCELVRREDYFLDLAAEEGWPKDRLRERIQEIRRERSSIEQALGEATQQLAAGQAVFHQALRLLEDPAGLYERGNEIVRATLNRAIFVRFMIDGKKVVGHELREPFRSLDGAYQRRTARQYHRTVGETGAEAGRAASAGDGLLAVPDLTELEARWFVREGGVRPVGARSLRDGTGSVSAWAWTGEDSKAAERPTLASEGGTADLTLTDLLDLSLTLRVSGSSRAVVVGAEGFEPPTPSV